jgi:hypothetical protein
MQPGDRLLEALKRPGMFMPRVSYDSMVAFAVGFDFANDGGPLVGFQEWICLKLGGLGRNLFWSELVLKYTFPDAHSPREVLAQNGEQDERAMNTLRKLLDEFWDERASLTGLRKIYVKYQRDLEKEEWYGPSSPHWIEP